MFAKNNSGTNTIIRSSFMRKSKTIAPMLCLVGLSACSSFGWTGSGINSASALTPAANAQPHANSGNAMLELGKTFARQGDHNAAIPLFRSAHQKNRMSVEPLVQLGKSLMAVGKYDDALDVLMSAKNKRGRDQEVLITLGQLYLAFYKPGTASGYFSEAIDIGARRPSGRADRTDHTDGRTATAYSGLGVSLELTGDHGAAQKAFDAGLAINANNLNLLSN
ncbi:MAG: tetratricopeptide repeat protein, partial [Sphingomonadales bacterium]|nr:tetratricopeptide repeat protein [Sphingomonadales bacterium]